MLDRHLQFSRRGYGVTWTLSFFSCLILALWYGDPSSAQGPPVSSAIQIVSPQDGAVFSPGDTFTAGVSVEPGTSFLSIQVIAENIEISRPKNAAPFEFPITIPSHLIGLKRLTAVAATGPGEGFFSQSVIIDIETPAILTALSANRDQVFFGGVGERIPIVVRGEFDDGAKLDITESTRVTYTSSNPSIATVDSTGHVTSTGPGNTAIIVAYGGTAINVPVSVPQLADGLTVGPFVVFGHEGVHIKQGSIIQSGDLGVNVTSEGPFLSDGVEMTVGLGVRLLAPASRVMGNRVKVKDNAQVYDVYYNELSGLGQIMGQQFTPVSLPLIPTLPAVPAFSPGTQNFDVSQNGTLTLEAGSYGTLLARKDATVTLTGGIYNFSSWDLRDNIKLQIQSPSEIRISGRLNTDQKAYVGPVPNAPNVNAANIVIYVTGQNGNSGDLGGTPKAAQFGLQNTVIANVYAPNGTLWIRQGSSATGAFLGKWVDVGENVTLAHASNF